MVPPSAARDGEVARDQGKVRGSEREWRQVLPELAELDELAGSFLPDDEEEEPESLFDDFDSEDDDSDDVDSEPDCLLAPSEPAFDFDDRLSVL
jgi:hypothetical protein